MSKLPPDLDEAFILGGAAVLRQNLSILTRRQSEKLFKDAFAAAEASRKLAFQEWETRWAEFDRAEKTRQREQAEARTREQAKAAAATPLVEGIQAHVILQIAPTAARTEINSAWRQLAAKWHPDKPGGDDGVMARINRARDVMLARAA